jgi:polyisoprenoid-binding protein YceI
LVYLIWPLVSLVASVARWLVQGQKNLYTMRETRYYAPDPDLGWKLVEHGPPRLGLELIGVMAAWTVGIGAAAWLVSYLERRRGRRLGPLRIGLWIAAALPLAVPVWAFAQGWLPRGAQTRVPEGVAEVAAGVVDGGLPGLPAGTWTIIEHAGTSATATIDAGGEQFEARFKRVHGWWRADPSDLRQPMTAEIYVDTSDVNTGIDLRSKHAREEYLQGEKFPRIVFRLERVLGAQARGNEVAFRATGKVEFVGGTHPVEVTGTLRAPDPAARQRLGLPADVPLLLVEARFEIRIADTALAPDRGDFGKDTIPLRVNVMMRPDVIVQDQGHQNPPGGK